MWLVATILGSPDREHLSLHSLLDSLDNISKPNSSSPARFCIPHLVSLLDNNGPTTEKGSVNLSGRRGVITELASFPLTSSELERRMDKNGDEDLNKGHLVS